MNPSVGLPLARSASLTNDITPAAMGEAHEVPAIEYEISKTAESTTLFSALPTGIQPPPVTT